MKMLEIFIVVALLAVVCLIYFFFRKSLPVKSPVIEVENNIPSNSEAQALYTKKNETEEKSFSLQEKIDRSWQFLIEIKEFVVNKFSIEDQDIVRDAGHKMYKHGMKYQHDINDFGNVVVKATSKEINKEQQQSLTR